MMTKKNHLLPRGCYLDIKSNALTLIMANNGFYENYHVGIF